MELFQPQKELATHLMAGSQRKMAGQKLSRQHHLQPCPNTKSMRSGLLMIHTCEKIGKLRSRITTQTLLLQTLKQLSLLTPFQAARATRKFPLAQKQAREQPPLLPEQREFPT